MHFTMAASAELRRMYSICVTPLRDGRHSLCVDRRLDSERVKLRGIQAHIQSALVPASGGGGGGRWWSGSRMRQEWNALALLHRR
jgi:hypothetical protein